MISNCMVSDMVIANCQQYEHEKQERNIKGQGKDVRNYSWKSSQLYKYYVLEILSICLI